MIYQECQTAIGRNIVEIIDRSNYDIFIRNIMVKFLLVQTQHPMMRYKCELATKVRVEKTAKVSSTLIKWFRYLV
jgi:translation initiation factor 2 beta subunit (eIF-2beta)/eIF-5